MSDDVLAHELEIARRNCKVVAVLPLHCSCFLFLGMVGFPRYVLLHLDRLAVCQLYMNEETREFMYSYLLRPDRSGEKY